jgi:hypothetical protein
MSATSYAYHFKNMINIGLIFQQNSLLSTNCANVGCVCGSISLYDNLLLEGYWMHIWFRFYVSNWIMASNLFLSQVVILWIRRSSFDCSWICCFRIFSKFCHLHNIGLHFFVINLRSLHMINGAFMPFEICMFMLWKQSILWCTLI